MVPCTWEPRAGCSPHTSLKDWAERSNPCLNLQAILCLGQPRGLVATLAKMAHCWFVVNFVSSRTPRAFSGRCFVLSVPGLSWCLRLFLAKSRTLHYPLLSFIPAQPIYPDSKDPSEWWHNHLAHQQLLPLLYSRSKRKFRWNSSAHKNVSQHSQANKPSFFRKLSQWRYHDTAFTDSDDLYSAGKGSLHFREWQWSAPFCTWQLEHTEFSASPPKRAQQSSPGSSMDTHPARAQLCGGRAQVSTAHSCEHIKCSPCKPLTTSTGRLHLQTLQTPRGTFATF